MVQPLILGGLALAGFVFLTGSWFLLNRTRAFKATATRCEGTVVDMAERRDTVPGGEWRTLYAPVVSFETGGKRVRFTASSWSSSKVTLHRKVTVVFDPKDPEGARIDSAFHDWGVPAIFGVLGLMLLGLAAALLVLSPRR